MFVSIAAAQTQPSAAPQPLWHFNAFADVAYIIDSNHPANNLFRNRSTTAFVDEPVLNMAAAYLRKDATEQSRWGMELTVQGGKDSEGFAFSPVAPNLRGSRWLRHLGPTNVPYLTPAGKGLTIQAGIFTSFIGYDSLYAKDNLCYIRTWGADYTPYLMMGVNASYPFTNKLTGTAFVVNDYTHLSNPNSAPSFGGQLLYKPNPRTTFKETVLYSPHQSDTSLEFWRFLSDTIAEWKTERFITAFEYQVGFERVVEPGTPRALWTAAQLPLHVNLHHGFGATFRPEFAWDRDGRWTGSPQFIKAYTSTLEYRVPYRTLSAIWRVEHRYDNSHGTGGGFWKDGFLPTGVPSLVPGQHLVAFALILTWEPVLHH
jgi:hypothetical protein